MTVFLKNAKEQRKYVEVRRRELEKERLDIIKSDIELMSVDGMYNSHYESGDLKRVILMNMKMFTDLGYDIIFERWTRLKVGESRFITCTREEYDNVKTESLRRITISWE
jgi:hypothetical protein